MAVPSLYRVTFAPEGELLAATLRCEIDIFRDAYGNTEQEWELEYGPYDASSVFISVSDDDGRVVGMCRLIQPAAAGLKTLNDVEREPWGADGQRCAAAAGLDLSRTWDIATIGVRRTVGGRAGVCSAALYHSIVKALRVNGFRWVVMMMDVRARRLLSALSLETHLLPGTRPGPYLGSTATAPLWADVPAMMDSQRRQNPDGYRLVDRGIGLDGISVPPVDTFRLRGDDVELIPSVDWDLLPALELGA